MLPRLQRIPGRKAKMPSKPDRSESQLNRYTSRALELLKWIGDELGHDEFSLEQILDTAPLDDPLKPVSAGLRSAANRLMSNGPTKSWATTCWSGLVSLVARHRLRKAILSDSANW